MIKDMKRIFELYKMYKMIRNNFPVFTLVKDIFEMLKNTSDNARPMYCKIALVNTKDGKHLQDFVSLWAGIGDSNPIERLNWVINQRNECKRLLIEMKEAGNLKPDQVKAINLIEEHFI